MKSVLILVLGFLIAGLIVAGESNQPDNVSMSPADSPLDGGQPALVRIESPPPRYVEPDNFETLTFGEYPCIPDCAEHEAGYQWGQEHGIRDADNCSGNTGAFMEGCRVYAEEQQPAVIAERN
jgi:hypothetical protein